jgi:glycosyltransferase involved in cell wall biosynthesis
MTKRQILMITPYLPRRSQSGGQNSSYYSIKYLAPKNDITLICFSRDEEALDDVKQYCKKVVIVKRGKTWDFKKVTAAIFGRFPFLVTNYISDELRQAIQDELNSNHFDLIHCDCFYPMPNIPKTDVPIMLVDLTIEYEVYKHFVDSLTGIRSLLKPLLMIDVLKLKYWETHYWKTTHTVTAFGTDDQKLISQVTGRNDIKVFQNGVDRKFYESRPKTKKSPFPSILFGVSNMKWMQNRESVDMILKDMWPKIKKAVPKAKLFIIGRNSPEYYGHLSNSDIVVAEAEIDGQKKDPQYYYYYNWVLLAPMGSGGGTRNKFLEAMACGLPIITTPEGMGGIIYENNRHAIVCPYSQVADKTIKLLNDPTRQKEIGLAARHLIKNGYSYEKSVEGLNKIYEEICRQSKT